MLLRNQSAPVTSSILDTILALPKLTEGIKSHGPEIVSLSPSFNIRWGTTPPSLGNAMFLNGVQTGAGVFVAVTVGVAVFVAVSVTVAVSGCTPVGVPVGVAVRDAVTVSRRVRVAVALGLSVSLGLTLALGLSV